MRKPNNKWLKNNFTSLALLVALAGASPVCSQKQESPRQIKQRLVNNHELKKLLRLYSCTSEDSNMKYWDSLSLNYKEKIMKANDQDYNTAEKFANDNLCKFKGDKLKFKYMKVDGNHAIAEIEYTLPADKNSKVNEEVYFVLENNRWKIDDSKQF
jgi:hypothetical protein